MTHDPVAQRPPGHAGRHRALGLGRTRRAAGRGPRICAGSATTPRCPPACNPMREVDLGGALVTPGPGRLPHPPGLRRPARARVRAAAAGRQLRSRSRVPAAASAPRWRPRARPATSSCSTRPASARCTLMAEGVTTLEIKSGYGLSAEHEARCLRIARRLGPRTAADGAHHLPVGACAAAGVRRPRRRLHRRRVRLAAGAARRRPGRCGRCLLRTHRLHAGADAARVRGRARAWACRSSCMPNSSATGAARRWPRPSARCPATTWSTCRPRACAPWPQPARVAVLLPGAFYFLRETKLPPIAGAARRRRADRAGQRPQPGLVAGAVAAADAEHGLHLLPHDARRSAARRHRARRACARPARPRHAGSRASAPTSSSGTSNTRTSWPTGSAATPAGASSSAAWRRTP